MKNIIIDGKSLTIDAVYNIAHGNQKTHQLELSKKSTQLIEKSRNYVDEIVKKEEPVYGINTGFGALSSKYIPPKDLVTLQYNLIRSHCTGVGSPFSKEITRAVMILRANCLASGFSGVSLELITLLLDFINFEITPVVPEQGSVGASGDLAPLSHIALALIGEGEVEFEGKIIASNFAINQIGKKPASLKAKDGLALINGTAVMAALGALAVYESERLIKIADISSCITLEAVRGTSSAYDQLISELKPHPGQIACANNLRKLLGPDSEIKKSHNDCHKVQDPYSLRCVPQVHGAIRQTLRHSKEVIEAELNAVTDNPLIFVDQNKVISGGNFHGEALAFVMDYLAIGLSELANIAERRVEKMMNPSFSDLPAFLIESSGLNSGLMIAQVTMAALASENKGLCHPSSVDSIPTSTDKEDHVSMGVTAGRKLHLILANVKNCLAIELLCNTQGLDFLRPMKSTPAVEAVHKLIRKHVDFIDVDRVFYHDIKKINMLVSHFEILNVVEDKIGPLE